MFNEVFRYKWHSLELLHGPLSAYLDEIAHELFQRGHGRRSVRNKFVVIGQLSRWMSRHNLKPKDLDDETMNKFIRLESKRVSDSLSDRGDLSSIKLLRKVLKGNGVLTALKPKSSRELLILEFEIFLKSEKGVTDRTVYHYSRFTNLFIEDVFGQKKLLWNKMNSNNISAFIIKKSDQWCPMTLKFMTAGLRAFFRFLKMRGYCQQDFANVVPRVPHWRDRNLPYYLESHQVEKLLKLANGESALDKRNYVILLLLARLGVRACEITKLTIDDLDWSNSEIIFEGKGVQKKRLPLSKEIGDALVDYLKVRKRGVNSRNVFLRSFPPYNKGITTSLVGFIVRKALLNAHIGAYKCGSHLLRHTAATQMLKNGASLSEIGTILGHNSVSSTTIYAKVDFKSLRSIVRAWPLEKSNRGTL